MECGERVVIDPEIPCKSGSAFQSIMASGTMKILQGSEARHALEVFYRHQTGVGPPFPEGGKTSSRCSALSAMSTPAKSA